ncbi:helix-turn-helix domain-containing protein [Streptomyces sp. HUAS TT20]|uniref:helix-turn-helix domain-containing protein n=1 Tax=Streptomyces sp. HUAS TT20 TaxID=3447509 RepID=UPI0021D9F3AC|nr:helix-turn-helix domain-containing protein [Streptomyces sp. HUAS 15-9]UXY28580.1 helix-turn-helix domain-containing protein [Streptomyces sp. HUAS 15-9]
MTGVWTREAVEALGPTTDVPTVASIFGVNKDTVYAQIRRGEWTATRVLTLGRKIKIPTRDLIALLYAPEASTEPAPHGIPAVPAQCHHTEYPQATANEPQSQCGCRVGESAAIRPLRGA